MNTPFSCLVISSFLLLANPASAQNYGKLLESVDKEKAAESVDAGKLQESYENGEVDYAKAYESVDKQKAAEAVDMDKARAALLEKDDLPVPEK